MLEGLTILIVEDQHLVGLDLSEMVQSLGGRVIGPIESVAEAMTRLEREPVAAAILDANLVDRDVTPLAMHLLEQGTPFVVYTGKGLPDELAQKHPELPTILKPAPAEKVLNLLVERMAGKDHATSRPDSPDRGEDRLD
jgi:DNA-binding NtrC family response regulator